MVNGEFPIQNKQLSELSIKLKSWQNNNLLFFNKFELIRGI